jgi:peptidoglycan/LPS O-acetylase OafA/YrhL
LNPTSDNRGYERRTELPALTSLRGLAALTVLLFHASSLALGYTGGADTGFALLKIWSRGYLAVDLFFILSGFVLTHVYGNLLTEDRTWRAVGRFLWARFCRIYPASAFAAGVCALQLTLGKVQFPEAVSFKAQLIGNLTLMQVPWLDPILLNPPSWSISAEFYAYLMFPFLVPVMLRLKTPAVLGIGAALLTAIAVAHGFDGYDRGAGWPALIRALPEFAAGIVAYRCYSQRFLRRFWQNDATIAGIIALTVAACFMGASDGAVVMLLLGLLMASVCNAGRLNRLIDARPLRWLGEISYSVYIFQASLFILVTQIGHVMAPHGLGGAWLVSLAVPLALASGAIVHRCVDKPARAMLRELPDRVMARAATYRRARPGTVALVPVRVTHSRWLTIARRASSPNSALGA